MESKLKLSFKKFFEKNLSKEKYINNATLAAQKALDKVRKMREARMFNISLYKYKGEIKGIKVVAKNPNTPHTSSTAKTTPPPVEENKNKDEEMEVIVPEKKIIDLVADDFKAPEKEEEKEEEKKEDEVMDKQQAEETEEEKPEQPPSSPKIPEENMDESFLKELMKYINVNKPTGDLIEEEVEEEIKRPKKAIPRRRRSQPIPKEESLEQSAQIPPRTPKPLPRPTRPAPPRRGRAISQKYVFTEPKIELPELNTEVKKPKRDYKNNKEDRIKAIHRMTFLE